MPRLPPTFDWPQVVLVLRERRNQTQAEFAESLGCSVSTVSKWERGETSPAAKHRRKMDELGNDVGYPASGWPEREQQTQLFRRRS